MPESDLGAAVFDLMTDWRHVLRRVETVHLVSEHSARRRVTVDVDVASTIRRLGAAAGTSQRFGRGPLYVPVALLRKDLFVDFDMRDASGTAIAVRPRGADSAVARAVLQHAAERALNASIQPSVIEKLYRIAHAFYNDRTTAEDLIEALPDALPEGWHYEEGWSDSAFEQWTKLLGTKEFCRLLAQFTTGFLLLAPINPTDDVAIIKYAYLSPSDPPTWGVRSRLGFAPARIGLETPNAWQALTYHLRLWAPQGLAARDAEWSLASSPGTTTSIHAMEALKKVTPFKVHLYARRIPEFQPLFAQLLLQLPSHGFLTVALLSVVFNFLLLLGSGLTLTLAGETPQHVEATVALLLAGPGLFAAYALRRAENAVVARSQRWPKVVVGLSLLMPYTAAALLSFGPSLPALRTWWFGLVGATFFASVFLATMLMGSRVGEHRTLAAGQRPTPITIEPA